MAWECLRVVSIMQSRPAKLVANLNFGEIYLFDKPISTTIWAFRLESVAALRINSSAISYSNIY